MKRERIKKKQKTNEKKTQNCKPRYSWGKFIVDFKRKLVENIRECAIENMANITENI